MKLHNQEQPSFNNRYLWLCVIYVWGINSDISRHNPSIDTFQGDNSIQYLCWWHNAAVLVISDWSSQVAFLQLFCVWMVTSNGDIMQQIVPTCFDNQSLWWNLVWDCTSSICIVAELWHYNTGVCNSAPGHVLSRVTPWPMPVMCNARGVTIA